MQNIEYFLNIFDTEINATHAHILSFINEREVYTISLATAISAIKDQIAKEALEINSMPRACINITHTERLCVCRKWLLSPG